VAAALNDRTSSRLVRRKKREDFGWAHSGLAGPPLPQWNVARIEFDGIVGINPPPLSRRRHPPSPPAGVVALLPAESQSALGQALPSTWPRVVRRLGAWGRRYWICYDFVGGDQFPHRSAWQGASHTTTLRGTKRRCPQRLAISRQRRQVTSRQRRRPTDEPCR
jgi:hypothetical protein